MILNSLLVGYRGVVNIVTGVRSGTYSMPKSSGATMIRGTAFDTLEKVPLYAYIKV